MKSIFSSVTVHNDDRGSLTGIQTMLQLLEGQQPAARGQQVSEQRNSGVFSQTAGPDCSPVTSPLTGSRRDVIHDDLLFLFQDGRACLMQPQAKSLMPFQQFINFLMQLNRIHHHWQRTVLRVRSVYSIMNIFIWKETENLTSALVGTVWQLRIFYEKNYIINIFYIYDI